MKTLLHYGNLEIKPDQDKKYLTVTELRDFLDELIKADFGDYKISASTQDGDSYNITGSVSVHSTNKELEFN